MEEQPVALADIETMLGVKITAAVLPKIGEDRVRIAIPDHGAKLVVVIANSNKWQNAARFTTTGDGSLVEYIAVLSGMMEVAIPGDDGIPKIQQYATGSVATIDGRKTHATRAWRGSCIVGIMSNDWRNAVRIADPAFDEAIERL